MAAGSKMHSPLAKAEPISDSGSTSGITHLIIGESNNPADTKVSKEGGEEVLHAPEQIPLQPVVKTMVRQAVPLQPMEVHRGADIHLQPVEDLTPEQADARRRL
ncbi:protein pxr1-like [Limosa lapponica baueri]|uniref:Protein pxr1-like n=1 Tax=Limosa lapponica baueri TaxID=1758121 RepID=A0A2I0TN48_LIMLA|nr:protein pxr1-like [Limosa lapponica baueri]